MKKKIILSVLFVLSLSPMLLNQYGGARGVQEISGCINLMNPIALASIFFYYFGVWVDFQQKKLLLF